ncbi:MAG: hypothetical protein NT069_26245 [Planctomycetota bacterium]|nr:hypothetical protein [Planctomycetota bacterium]
MRFDDEFVLDWAASFFTDDFTAAMAKDVLGPAVDEDDKGLRVFLVPTDPRIERAVIDFLKTPRGREICSVTIKFHEPQSLDIDKIAAVLGPPTEMPRLKPHAAIPLMFVVENPAWAGNVQCLVPQGKPLMHWVESILFNRMHP